MTDLQNYFHGGTVEALCHQDLGVIVLNVSVLCFFYKIIFFGYLRFTAKQRKVQRFSYTPTLHSSFF